MMILIGVLTFALLVVVHEFGHFIVARRNGVEVEEFGIGFPPKLFGKQIGKTEYTFNLIPLGGFVKLKGESDSDEGKGSFGASSLPVKAKILLAGVGMNVISAIVIVFLLAVSQLPSLLEGQYTVADNQTVVEERLIITSVGEETPASEANIEPNSEILTIAGEEVATPADLDAVAEAYVGQVVDIELQELRGDEVNAIEFVMGSPKPGYLGVVLEQDEDASTTVQSVASGSAAEEIGMASGDVVELLGDMEIATGEELTQEASSLSGETTTIAYERNGELIVSEVTLGTGGPVEGAAVFPEQVSRYTWAAPLVAIGVTFQMIGLVFSALGSILAELLFGAAGNATDQLAGPVGIVFLLQNLGDLGLGYLFFLLASISVSLAVFNALPVPALDGGRLAVIGGARLLRKPLRPEVENAIHGIGFMLLIGLFILITYVDIQRFF